MTNHFMTRFWLWGGLTGLLFPLASFALLSVCQRTTSGIVLAFLLFTVFSLEAPTVIIGRILHLPIEIDNEISDPIFIAYQLSPFGYILVLVFWICVGLGIGFVIGKILSAKNRTVRI